MAEVAAMTLGETAVPAAAGRGRGKAKGRGKFKAKAKGKKNVAAGGAPKEPKVPKVSLRAQVEAEIGNRDMEEVIKEARAKVEELKAAVASAQDDELKFEKDIGAGKIAMGEASAKVDECVHKETLALEVLKDVKRGLIEAQKKTSALRLAAGDEDKALDVLKNAGEDSKKEADLLKEKADAQAAKEAAKKAYNEAILKAKQVAEEIKNKRSALALTDDPEAAERAKAEAERAAVEEKARKEAMSVIAKADADLKAENKQLERERAERDKMRAKAFKEAAGLGSKKRAISNGVAASPAKAAKMQDVD
jgi:colicin import membrane protein